MEKYADCLNQKIDYIVVLGIAWLMQTIVWKSNFVATLGYWGNVLLFSVVLITVYHIGNIHQKTSP